eukprot:1691717-Prymnesium_polylepis.1
MAREGIAERDAELFVVLECRIVQHLHNLAPHVFTLVSCGRFDHTRDNLQQEGLRIDELVVVVVRPLVVHVQLASEHAAEHHSFECPVLGDGALVALLQEVEPQLLAEVDVHERVRQEDVMFVTQPADSDVRVLLAQIHHSTQDAQGNRDDQQHPDNGRYRVLRKIVVLLDLQEHHTSEQDAKLDHGAHLLKNVIERRSEGMRGELAAHDDKHTGEREGGLRQGAQDALERKHQREDDLARQLNQFPIVRIRLEALVEESTHLDGVCAVKTVLRHIHEEK